MGEVELAGVESSSKIRSFHDLVDRNAHERMMLTRGSVIQVVCPFGRSYCHQRQQHCARELHDVTVRVVNTNCGSKASNDRAARPAFVPAELLRAGNIFLATCIVVPCLQSLGALVGMFDQWDARHLEAARPSPVVYAADLNCYPAGWTRAWV